MSTQITTADQVREAAEHVGRPLKAPVESTGEYARQRRDEARASAARILDSAERDKRQPTGTERRAIDSEMATADVWGKRYRAAKRDSELSAERAFVRRESLVYESGSDASYFRDLLASKDDPDAGQRLQRHARQMKFEYARRDNEARKAEQRSDHYEFRTTPTVAGSGTLAPPLYLIEDAALVPRSERVFSRNVITLPLPDGVSSIRIPAIAHATGNVTPQPEGAPITITGIEDTEVIASTITTAGAVDISMQLLEQSKPSVSGIDTIIYRSLLAAYDETIESQVINGKGEQVSGRQIEFTGVLNTPGITEVVASGTTAPETYAALGKTFGTVSKRRRVIPTGWYLTGNRWAWYGVSRDESGRPLTPPIDMQTPRLAQPIGGILGAPASVSEPVGDEHVIVAKADDSFLFEGTPRLATFTESLSGDLMARIRLHSYAAFVARQPTGIGVVNGLPAITWSEA